MYLLTIANDDGPLDEVRITERTDGVYFDQTLKTDKAMTMYDWVWEQGEDWHLKGTALHWKPDGRRALAAAVLAAMSLAIVDLHAVEGT